LTDEGITATVKAFGGVRDLIDAPLRVELPCGATVHDLLDAVYEKVPGLRERLSDGLSRGYLAVLIDGRNVRFLQGMDTPLSNGSTVALLPPVGGG
jgi:sulfur-carrier protein